MKSRIYLVATAIVFCTMVFASSCKKSETTAVVDISRFTGRLELCYRPASAIPNPKCFLDCNTGIAYSISEAPTHADEIDLIWNQLSINNQYVIQTTAGCIGAYESYYPQTTLFANWPNRNLGIIESSSAMDVTKFSTITSAAELTTYIGGRLDFTTIDFQFLEATSADFAKVYLVETNYKGAKKRGVIKFTSGQAGDGGFVNYEIIIAK